MDLEGVIRGARLVEHHEPIVLIGIPERRITAVIDAFVGLDIAKLVRSPRDEHYLDIVRYKSDRKEKGGGSRDERRC